MRGRLVEGTTAPAHWQLPRFHCKYRRRFPLRHRRTPMHDRLSPPAICLLLVTALPAADQPQWGQPKSRNMVSDERGLVDSFDPATGRNVRWTADLGAQSFATPVVASGKVLIGGNNDKPRDPKQTADCGVLLCLDARDGTLAWQLLVPKRIEDDRYFDWPKTGWCSSPTVDGNRAYVITNRAEVVCLDMAGMTNGNDGPYTDEGRHMALRGQDPLPVGDKDGDILWLTDLHTDPAVGMWPHDG